MIIKDLSLIKSINKGRFDEVFLASKKGINKFFAVKKILKTIVNIQEIKNFFNNKRLVLKKKNHPNIINFYEIFETLNNFYIVYELCNGGDLSNCLKKYKEKYNKPFNQEITQSIMKQIISGLQYLHNNNIIHRDLKLDNILIQYDNEEDKNNLNILKGQIKLIDFGFERYLKNDSLANDNVEIPFNNPPEFFQNKNNYNKNCSYNNKADTWSLGIICYQMLTGNLPFDGYTFKELNKKFDKGDYQIAYNLSLSKEAIKFINEMLQFDFEKRLSIDNLVNHDFLIKKINDFTYFDLEKIKNKININLNIKEKFEETKPPFQFIINSNNTVNLNDIKNSMKTISNDNSHFIPNNNSINSPKLNNRDNNCVHQNDEEIE